MATKLRSIRGQKSSTAPDTIEERVARLEIRLQDGFARIGEAMNHGLEVNNWERHWIELLREYESLQDELAEAA